MFYGLREFSFESFLNPFLIMKTYEIKFGHHILRYSFHFDSTFLYMMPYIKESESEGPVIISPLEYMEKIRHFFPENQEDSYVEYKSLINLSSLALLHENAVFFHATAIKYKGKAWLFTGKSGAGKTTQYKKWKIKYRDEVELICGDMPCLELNNNEIHVYPSPWNGKERLKGKADAPLGGLIFLEKSDHNEIIEISANKIIIPLMLQFVVGPRNEEEIRSLSKIADIIIRDYPIIKNINKADEESVILCSQYLEKYL